ncbi:hypothetical protein GQ457_16G017450 [Hibiscus cannabinus]
MNRSCTQATQSIRTQNMSRKITSRESLPRAKERKIRKGLCFHQHNCKREFQRLRRCNSILSCEESILVTTFFAWCMTRANPRGPRYDLDPEIERTQKQLKRRIRDLMERNNNNGQPPVDGKDLPAQADRVIAPLKLFPYSLRDKDKTWLNNLQPGSLQYWTQLCCSFLAKFSYTNMTHHLRNQITSFRQVDDEAMHEAWERYRDLFRRCPMHGRPEWTQVSIFYNSVNTPTRMMLDASANGTLLDKPPREFLEILDKLVQNDYQHPTSRRGNTRQGPAQLDSSDTILAQIASLTNMVKNKQKQPHIQEVKALDAFCDQCGSNHDASECGQQVE